MLNKIIIALCIFTLMPVALYALTDAGRGYTAHYVKSDGYVEYEPVTGLDIGTTMFKDGLMQVIPYEEDGEYYFPLISNLIRGNLSAIRTFVGLIKTIIK